MSVTNDLADPAGLFAWELRMLTQVSEALNGGVLCLELFHGCTKFLFREVQWLVGNTACLKNDLMNISPHLDISQLLSLREDKLFTILDFIRLVLSHGEKALWYDLGSVEDSGECSSEQMSLFTSESRVRVDGGVQITREDVLDLTGLLDVIGAAVWKLDPIGKKVVGNPEDCFVDAFTTRFDR